ncbi:MAG: protoporphyrinogen oxidase [Acidimicrobiales bacterium]
MTRIVVVGAGMAGLSTALTLHRNNIAVDVLEASGRVGGKVLTTEIAGTQVDAGADAFLVREAHVTDLCDQLHLTPDLVAPATGAAKIWYRGALRPLPRKQYLGVPLDLDELESSELLTPEGRERAAQDLRAPADAPAEDESVGALIRRRLGDEVMDQLVGPLLGGINAGDGDQLSLQAGVPQLAAAAAHDESLLRSIPAHLASLDRDPDAPIFLTHPRGVGQIIDAMADHLRSRIHLEQPVQSLEPADSGWIIEAKDTFEADAVVLAAPAFASAAILAAIAPESASMLASIHYASVVMVTFAFASAEMPELTGSGFLIPRHEGLLMTACSQTSTKWAHLGDRPTTFLRVSAGHSADDRAMRMSDEEITEQLLTELSWTTGIHAEPREIRITRWPSSLPQYQPGHLDRVSEIERTLAAEAPGVFVTGAAFRGLGLPACVHQGRVAAATAADHCGVARPEPTGPGFTPQR